MTRSIIILAAGASSRFGSPKALAPWRSGTLLSHAIATARAVIDTDILIVTGGYASQIVPALGDVRHSHNPDWAAGIGTSIATGTRAALTTDPETIAILPVDQPCVTAAQLQHLLAAAQAENRICFSRDGDLYGPPVAVPRAHFSSLLDLSPSQGLKSVVDRAACIFIDQPGVLADIDRPADLARLTKGSQ